MAKKSSTENRSSAIDTLKNDLATGEPKRFYIFHGPERYLLEHYLGTLRTLLCPGGLNDFNYRRYEGKGLDLGELSAACDTLPAFAERTLVEIHDYDFFKFDEAQRESFIELLTDLPEHVCLVFVYIAVEYAPDKRQKKLSAALKNTACVVEFAAQAQSQLVKWIKKHFKASGKTIDTPTAEYLAFITGGLMTTLSTEIEKLCFYVRGESVTRGDIDAVVTPVLDAVSWKLTDSLVSGRFNEASHILTDLLNMREPPHKLIYSITVSLRRLLAARLCLDSSCGEKDLMRMTDIRFEFQARNLMSGARKTTAERCRRFVLLSADTAFRMNSGGDPQSLLTELLIKLATCYKGCPSC